SEYSSSPAMSSCLDLLFVWRTLVLIKVTSGSCILHSDVVLPCSLSTKENIVPGEVFLYDGGIHYNNGRGGQSEEFKGRVSHFQDELKHGNASIIIRNTKISDSGVYTCGFPRLEPRQTFNIELVVERHFLWASPYLQLLLFKPLTKKLQIQDVVKTYEQHNYSTIVLPSPKTDGQAACEQFSSCSLLK
uniref:Immunoglobulin domain-containing protein n=1 Tax=Sander lucioperca TaxID=283035 RepID=A0A8C9XGX1_SANLU